MFVVAQVANARRLKVPRSLSVVAIDAACAKLAAFEAAGPSRMRNDDKLELRPRQWVFTLVTIPGFIAAAAASAGIAP